MATVLSGSYVRPSAGRATFHDFAAESSESQDWKETTREGVPRVLAELDRVLPDRVTRSPGSTHS